MKILKLTAKDFKNTNSYYKEYCGSENVTDFNGHLEIEGNLGWVKFTSVKVSGYIVVKAGSGIEAGEGIKAGLIITCKLSLKFAYRIFAGICYWRKELKDEDKLITCGKFEGGEVAYGILKEIGLPKDKVAGETSEVLDLSDKEVEVYIDGKVYKAVIK